MNPPAPGFQVSQQPRLQLMRRDFLYGSMAGAAATIGAGFLTPLSWRLRTLPDGTKVSYSQAGEDIVALTLLKGLHVDKPSYLDVGAFLPILGNNTYLLYREGGRGVLVEPNVSCIRELERKRPGDTVLNVGIGFSQEETTGDYYVLNFPQMNTFDADEAKRRERDSNGKTVIKEIVKMPLVPINKVIAENFGGGVPDYLSIDVEGLELTILQTLDFERYRPKLICADTLTDGGLKMNTGTADFLSGKGYAIRGMTPANTLFVDQRLLG
ncbi:MAG TPA: FkbM family methyltransferase [Gemmataceae bacterium]|nr:FkbM family methyltransferase [Gemmataceae bacterium]